VLRPNDEYTAAHTRTRNVFMVIPEAIPVLEAHGLLCQSPIPPETIPSANDYGWSTVASVAPHSGQITSEWHAVYLSALNAYAHARDPNLSAAKRLGYFNFADDICRHLLTTEPTVPRVMTAIRLAYEGGRDDDALALARTLADELRSQQGRVFFEPFVAPHAAIDWMTPAEDQVAWAQSVALVAVERMRHWSALFSAAESTQLWKELSIYPWWEDEARRMLCVLGQLWE
jgi:hypothetical protein